MIRLNFHPAANIFPLFDDSRLTELAEDIKAFGQREPIKVYDGLILDGRNRYRACELLGIEPVFEELATDINPWAYVWSLNGSRRDLNTDQRYLIWKRCDEQSISWVEEQAKRKAEANRKRSESQVGIPKTDKERVPTSCGQTLPYKKSPTAMAKALASKTNRGTVERLDAISDKRPDLADRILTGELKTAQVLRIIKKDELDTKLAALPTGQFTIIYADPPWSYNDKCDDGSVQSGGCENHYPSLTLSELKVLDVRSMSAPDSVLFLWATSPLLPDALELAKAWGFAYKASFVWDKVKHNMGHYNSVRHEFLLVCTKGSCTPQVVTLFDSVQTIERTEHSVKPDEFRSIIDTLYPKGPRIELFARRNADGWASWGNEI